jgi:tight adherence protein C
MTLLEFGLLALIFGVVTLGTFLVVVRANRRQQRTEERLHPPTGSSPDLGSTPEMVLGELTPSVGAALPMGEAAKADIQRELLAAGYYKQTAVVEFAALRTVLVLTPLVGALVLALLVDTAQILNVILGGVILAMIGYSVPRFYIYFRGRMRARQIEAGLPMVVDMLTLSLTAGQNILASIQRVSREIRFAHPILADELEIVRQQAELRNLPQAMKNFADRVQVPEVHNLSMILIQSERLGSDAANALLEYSNNLRINLRQRADQAAARTQFWLLFPIMLCLWIPSIIILLGPGVLEFQKYRDQATEDLRQGFEDVREANQPLLTTPPPAASGGPTGNGNGPPR